MQDTATRQRALDLLRAYSDAWNRHDLDAIMALTSDDCEFWSAAGIEARGGHYIGRAAVAGAYEAIFRTFPDGRWTDNRLSLVDDGRALAEWHFVGTMPDGRKVELLGVDILEFAGDKVRVKDTYRKTRL